MMVEIIDGYNSSEVQAQINDFLEKIKEANVVVDIKFSSSPAKFDGDPKNSWEYYAVLIIYNPKK